MSIAAACCAWLAQACAEGPADAPARRTDASTALETSATCGGAQGDNTTSAATPAAEAVPALASSSWQARIIQRVADDEYAVRSDGDEHFIAVNRAHALVARLDGEGAELSARQGAHGRVVIQGAGIARGATRQKLAKGRAVLGACRKDGATDARGECLRGVESQRGQVTELWENRKDGIEHTFIVNEELAGTGPLEVLVAVRDADVVVAAAGDEALIRAHEGPLSLRYAGLRAWDSAQRPLPAYMRMHAQGIALVVDTTDALYPITIDPLLTSVAWSAEGNEVAAHFGIAVASAGDVNGDGYGDVIVGASDYDAGQSNEGRAFVYLGSGTGLSSTAAWTAESNQAEGHFGSAVASAGDVNRDGYGDVIVGASGFDAGEADEGRAFVYLGSGAGLSSTAAWTAESDQAQAHFGNTVASAGDIDGDGYGDVIVGASDYDAGEANEGRAFVYLGSGAGLSSTAAWTAESDQADARFGSAATSAGDVNRDGYGDVIVGARDYDAGEANEGRAFVYLGSAAGLAGAAAWTAEGDQIDAHFGIAAAGAGDVNGDGYADVIIGASDHDAGEANEGGAFVFHGAAAGLDASAAWTVHSDQAGAQLGIAVGSAGDVNGDGYADVVIGASGYDGGEVDEGRAYVYLGGASGLPAAAAWTVESDQASAGLGAAVASAGDVNGDGYAEVIAGASNYDGGESNEGRALVYLGSGAGLSTTADATAESDQNGAAFGSSVASAGDVNGDGYGDVIVGASSYAGRGRAFTYLGSAEGLATTAAWIVDGTQASGFFGASVASAGDINGDGYGDVIVGAFGHNATALGGRAFVYHGSAAGLGTTAAWSSGIAGAGQAGASYGRSVASAGDVNGDGYGDVIVGARFYDGGLTDEGAAFVYHGSASGLATTPAWTVEGDQASAIFGVSVAGAGDVNGDGYGDVIVGAYWYDNGQSNEGRAYVYRGSATGVVTAPLRVLESNQAFAYYGYSVSGAGDVNGDGYGDVVVGSYGATAGQSEEGRVYLYRGGPGGTAATPLWSADSNQANAQLGRAVASAGDVNGDGYGDVIAGAPFYHDGESGEGRAYLFLGAATSSPPAVAWIASGNQVDAGFGGALASAGDVNGDGYAEVIAGASGYDNGQTDEGRTFLYQGNRADGTTAAFALSPRAQRTGTTTPLTTGNALIAHTFDALTGTGSHFGRGRARLELEVKPSPSAFDGTATVLAASFEDIDTLESRVLTSGFLAFGQRYQYRVRLRYDPSQASGQLASHWYYGGMSGQARSVHLRTCTDADGDDYADPACGGDDSCAADPGKSSPGVCGCGTPDTDSDSDTTPDCVDACASDPGKIAPGLCGCGIADTDSDADTTPDCLDGCATDPNKITPGLCGCGIADTDSDGDAVPDCNDACPADAAKTAPGVCGCGVADTDTDADATPDCIDACPIDPAKIALGVCGCGVADTDTDADATPDCIDGCAIDPTKIAPGVCGCGVADTDSDGDATPDCIDGCATDPIKIAPGQCGCGIADTDSDGDGTASCNDACPADPGKTTAGQCGCAVADTDSDGDGTANCNDACPSDPGDISAPCGPTPAPVPGLGDVAALALASLLLFAGASSLRARRRAR